jgi:hypothetical protein
MRAIDDIATLHKIRSSCTQIPSPMIIHPLTHLMNQTIINSRNFVKPGKMLRKAFNSIRRSDQKRMEDPSLIMNLMF